MANHWFLRSLVLVLAAFLAASRGAAAQQSRAIRVAATVTAPAGPVTLAADTASAAPRHDTQRVRIAGVGRLDIQTGPGAAVRIATVNPAPNALRTTHPGMRITIDYVGN